MSSIKLVHIIKHLELIDRDVNELRKLEEVLINNRAYSDTIRISLELQINNLLNERIKLMELKIENPPHGLKKINDDQELYANDERLFDFDNHEEQYLPRLLEQAITPKETKTFEQTRAQQTFSPQITQTFSKLTNTTTLPITTEPESNQNKYFSNIQSPISKRSLPLPKKDNDDKIKDDIKVFLKSLPTLDY